MDSKIKKHGFELAQILEDAEDLEQDVEEARDALVQELISDPETTKVISTFQSLFRNHKNFVDFHHNEKEAFLYYQLGKDPDSVSLEDAPYTAATAKIHYNGSDISAKVEKQDITRLDDWIRDTSFEVFVDCYYIREPRVLDMEDFLEARDKEREIEKLAKAPFVDLRDENRGYFVINEDGEVLKNGLTRREARNLTEEDFE